MPIDSGKFYLLEGEYFDADGNPIQFYIPRIDPDYLDQMTPTAFYDSMVAIDMRTGNVVEVDASVKTQVANTYGGIGGINLIGAWASLEKYFQANAPDVLAYPDVQEYLLERAKLWQQGVPFDLTEMSNISKRLTTEPDFAKQMRAAGLMGANNVVPLPQKQEKPLEQVWSGYRYYNPEEVKGKPELAGANIVIAPDIESARSMGASRYIPTKDFNQAKYEQAKQQMESLRQAGYPIDEEFVEQHARAMASPNEPIHLSLAQDVQGVATTYQIQEQQRLAKEQQKQWDELKRKALINPQRKVNI